MFSQPINSEKSKDNKAKRFSIFNLFLAEVKVLIREWRMSAETEISKLPTQVWELELVKVAD